MGLEDELRAGKFDPFTKIDKSLIELLYDHHPDLNHKEFAICRIIADTLWDLSGDAIYVEIVARAQNQLSQLFENTEEIEDVIKVLIRKGIVKCKTYSFLFGNNGWQTLKILMLKHDIEKEFGLLKPKEKEQQRKYYKYKDEGEVTSLNL